ncbi:sensor histidine kinase [Saccharicrinis aurantiacus]|uniref:sensor histidine kinase n=1 Tax=Saccharicrinis aurantiacus TaxID=1849719 RepID=UPI00094F4E4E|nr:ATP-binding protein [Saccharicrinis aurantiacus]
MDNQKSYEELELELLAIKNELAEVKANCCKATEVERLLDERIKYLTMLENVTDVIGIIDINGITKFKSHNVENLFGWSSDELMNQPAVNNIHPDDREGLISAFQSIISGNLNQFTTEFRYHKKDGKYTWVEFSAVNNINTPNINGILVNYHDISDRIKAKEDLLESEARYRMLFTNMDDSSSLYEVVTDDNGEPIDYKFIAVNPAFEASVGYTDDYLKGKTLLGEFPATEQVWLDTFKKVYKTGKAQRIESYTDVLDMYFDIIAFIPQEGLLSMIGVDITERKKNEISELENKRLLKEQNEEYLSINEELSERNEEFAILNDQYKIQNEALYKAMEKAKESDLLKSTFLQIMSHEIRTPMNAIYGFAELLSEVDSDMDMIKDYSSIIKNSSEQLLSVVNNVLTISSLETKQEEVVLSKVNLSTLLEEQVAIFKMDTKLSISHQNSLNGSDVELNTDRTKLTQIISNLLSNAIKFSEEGEIKMACCLEGDFVKFSVCDCGIGIHEEEQAFIFEQFRQANHNIQKKYGGTGLGLTISKAFIELLGGRIWFESEEGKGTQFFFTLPRSL